MGARALDRAFFARSSLLVAPQLLGCVLRVADGDEVVAIRITEVEAYEGADDPASHSYRGQTPRNAVMFGPAGHLYCYFSYGVHTCVNIVCGRPGTASAVLLRAGEVTDGAAQAAARRPTARLTRDLARGPGNFAAAGGLTLADNGLDLCAAPNTARTASIAKQSDAAEPTIATGPRVGVSQAADRNWRFWIKGDPTVSAYKRSPRAPALGIAAISSRTE